MVERGRGRRLRSRLAVGPAAAAIAAAVVLGIPATATAAVTRSVQPAVVAGARTAGVIVQGQSSSSHSARLVGTDGGAGVAAATGGSSTEADSGSLARVTEGTRTDGVLGQWVVVVLLGLVVTLWVTLVAVVVRVRLRLAHSSGHAPEQT